MTNHIINPLGLWVPQTNFARFNRIGPGRCCCSTPMPGCSNPPAWLDQSNIPEFVTYTLPDSDCICFAGKKITLRYERCMSVYSQGILLFYYIYRADLGTCNSYTYRASLFLRIYGPPYTEGIPSTAYQTRLEIRDYSAWVYGDYHCVYEPDLVPWPGDTASVTEAISSLPEIESGDSGEPSGCWCNGYDDGSIAFGITKQRDNTGPYDDGGYHYPSLCCPSKGATELICSLDLTDVVIFRYEGSSFTYQRTALLSELTSAVALAWRYRQCGNYDKGYTCFVPIRVFNECFPITPGACDLYNTPFYETTRFELQYIWYLSADPETSHLRIVDNNVGCANSNWIVYTENVSPDLPACNSNDFTGVSATSALGTITVEEAVYCEIP